MAEVRGLQLVEAPSRARNRSRSISRSVLHVLLVVGLLTGTRAWSAAQPRPTNRAASPADVVVDGPGLRRLPVSGQRLPSFRAPDVRGEGLVSWPPSEGGPTRLVVFTPWCPSCRSELARLTRSPQDGIVGVLTGAGRYGQDPVAFIEETGVEFPVALDDGDGTLATSLGVERVPATFHVDARGTVLRTVVGDHGDTCVDDAAACGVPPE